MKREPPPGIDVTTTVASAPESVLVKGWTQRLLTACDARGAGLSILLCGDARMRRLNREWMGKDRATDVLSFPSLGRRGFLGDVAIDVPCAARHARRRGHGRDREIQILLAHGLLHLLGHDHETDNGEMFELQSRVVRGVFGPGPVGVPQRERRRGRP